MISKCQNLFCLLLPRNVLSPEQNGRIDLRKLVSVCLMSDDSLDFWIILGWISKFISRSHLAVHEGRIQLPVPPPVLAGSLCLPVPVIAVTVSRHALPVYGGDTYLLCLTQCGPGPGLADTLSDSVVWQMSTISCQCKLARQAKVTDLLINTLITTAVYVYSTAHTVNDNHA